MSLQNVEVDQNPPGKQTKTFFFRWIWHLRLFQLEYTVEISNSSNTLHTLVRHVIPTGQRWTKPYDMMWFAHHTRLWFAIELGRILEDLHCQEAVIRQVMLGELHGPAREGWKVIGYWSSMDFQPVGLKEKSRRIRTVCYVLFLAKQIGPLSKHRLWAWACLNSRWFWLDSLRWSVVWRVWHLHCIPHAWASGSRISGEVDIGIWTKHSTAWNF